jgi:uncharacterized protein
MGQKITKEMIAGIMKFKKEIKVERIIVFGSYASGRAKKHSDIDLVLIGKKFRGRDFLSRYKGLWLKWTLDMPVDFIAYTPEEFEKQSKEVSIASEALREGIEIR